jgi:alpha-1,2-mannosyltransferase
VAQTGIAARRQALIAWAVCVCLATPVLLWKLRWGEVPRDLAVYREAGRVLAQGGDLYGPGFGSHLKVPLPFTYPPLAGILAVPLGWLPGWPLTLVWAGFSLTALVVLVGLSFRPLLDAWPGRSGLRWGLIAGLFAWTTPVTDTLFLGQISLFVVLACALDCTVTRRGRGVLVGVATAVKLTPGLFTVYFLVTRQWRAALVSTVTTAGLWLVAWISLPSLSHTYWTQVVRHTERIGDAAFYANQSINGMLHRLGAPGWLWLPLALAAAVLGLTRARTAHIGGHPFAAATLVGLASLLVSPVSWQHHAGWVIPAVGVVVGDGRSARRLRAALAIMVVFLLRLPLIGSATSIPVVSGVAENAYVIAYWGLLLWLPTSTTRATRTRPLTTTPR